jgi:hypothetical protein
LALEFCGAIKKENLTGLALCEFSDNEVIREGLFEASMPYYCRRHFGEVLDRTVELIALP